MQPEKGHAQGLLAPPRQDSGMWASLSLYLTQGDQGWAAARALSLTLGRHLR